MGTEFPEQAGVLRFAGRIKESLPPNFSIAVQPRVGDYSPDLIVTSPTGGEVVVEVKLGSGLLHIADLAQVAAYREALKVRSGNPSPAALLVTTRKGSALVSEAARRMGIGIVGPVGESELADMVANAIRDYAMGLGEIENERDLV